MPTKTIKKCNLDNTLDTVKAVKEFKALLGPGEKAVQKLLYACPSLRTSVAKSTIYAFMERGMPNKTILVAIKKATENLKYISGKK